ncbi:hypothetical protein B0T16DRAFT_406604 [Cercophora newfieldiana]|uniref:Uncharacterized protein n=1 Tax=Cercophora newfieldiana TaxID=92897 RepID=A0AA39YJD6_9PEZI|nr:hypothetical protein B0T16DRAFT_406604 [Cercophora newfieldiana]
MQRMHSPLPCRNSVSSVPASTGAGGTKDGRKPATLTGRIAVRGLVGWAQLTPGHNPSPQSALSEATSRGTSVLSAPTLPRIPMILTICPRNTISLTTQSVSIHKKGRSGVNC